MLEDADVGSYDAEDPMLDAGINSVKDVMKAAKRREQPNDSTAPRSLATLQTIWRPRRNGPGNGLRQDSIPTTRTRACPRRSSRRSTNEETRMQTHAATGDPGER
jgi:hypothetical protein